MLHADTPETLSVHRDRRRTQPSPEYIEMTELAILDAAHALGTLDGRGASPQSLVDQVLLSYEVREADFARAVGRLVASEHLEITHGEQDWTYALTAAGHAHMTAWEQRLQQQSTSGPIARIERARTVLATRVDTGVVGGSSH